MGWLGAVLAHRAFPGRLRGLVQTTRCALILGRDYGHSRSAAEQRACDASGAPQPWYTYPAIHFLDGLDWREAKVFEYGSGASTLWWAARTRSVVAVEIDGEWARRVAAAAPANVEILLRQDRDAYVQSIEARGGLFDVIIVDGAHRRACAAAARRRLAPGGVMILDNADWHVDAAADLRASGLLQVDFTGFTPINGYTSTTSVFFARDAAWRPRGPHQPAAGPGSKPPGIGDESL